MKLSSSKFSTSSAAPPVDASVESGSSEVELEQEEDGCWIAEVVDLPGVLVYGSAPETAVRGVRALALRVLADKVEHGELDARANRVEFLIPQPLPAA